ncbi:hypothetical protein XENOCAPTIV_007078 [Xenoophorus captivus]|uniref:Uncharacterized protein n=1 Tax=Xenoophorus captivus TaxID=1517983 RepID=A0ABV0RYG6_9TELE
MTKQKSCSEICCCYFPQSPKHQIQTGRFSSPPLFTVSLTQSGTQFLIHGKKGTLSLGCRFSPPLLHTHTILSQAEPLGRPFHPSCLASLPLLQNIPNRQD